MAPWGSARRSSTVLGEQCSSLGCVLRAALLRFRAAVGGRARRAPHSHGGCQRRGAWGLVPKAVCFVA